MLIKHVAVTKESLLFQVFSLGNNSHGQLGNGATNNLTVPTLVQGDLKGKIVVKISCGCSFSVCVLDSGEVCFFIYLIESFDHSSHSNVHFYLL